MTDIVWPLFDHNIVCTLVYVNFVLIWEMPILDNLLLRVHKLSITEISTGLWVSQHTCYIILHLSHYCLRYLGSQKSYFIIYRVCQGYQGSPGLTRKSRIRVMFLALWKVVRLLQKTTIPRDDKKRVLWGVERISFKSSWPVFPVFCSLNLWT